MNVLLLTDVPPCNNYTGGIMLRQMCDFLIEEKHNIFCFSVETPNLNPNIPEHLKNKIKYQKTTKPNENWGRGRIRKAVSLIKNNYNTLFEVPKIAQEVRKYIKENNIDMIWTILQGQTMIKLAYLMGKRSKIPFMVQIWDPPEWWLNEHNFDKYTKKNVLNTFYKVLKVSESVMCASWAMAQEYSRFTKAKCIPVIPGLDITDIKSKPTNNKEEFIIGFAGQVYAESEFQHLINALDNMNWEHNNKKIKLKLYGRHFNLSLDKPSNIEIGGWLRQNDTIEELAAADLLYCPYGFSWDFEKIARLSFPSKLTTYLKTKKAVLFHGPSYSSPYKFLLENDAGYLCTGLNEKEIEYNLKRIIDDKNISAIGERGYIAFKKYLTFESMKRNFFISLNLIKSED